ncbi:proline dehydrogenase family protein [Flexivirga lutea]
MIDPGASLRQGLLGLSRHDSVRRVVRHTPVSRSVARRFVAGTTVEDCVRAVAGVVADGRLATIELLGHPVPDGAEVRRTRDAHLALLRALQDRDLTARGVADLVIDLDTLGRALAEDGAKIALDNVLQICEAAARAGTTVTIAPAGAGAADATLDIVRDLRSDFPDVGATLPAELRRTEADCRELAGAGSRVVLCARTRAATHTEPGSRAFLTRREVQLSYVRCLKILLEGEGHPVIAAPNAEIFDIARSLADKQLRAPESFEFELPLGVRPLEQRRLLQLGYQVRVLVPYGEEWSPYVMRLLAEHPVDTLRSR